MEPKKPFHETVAEKLIEQLKEGVAPWQKPWEPAQPGAFMPMNPTSGKRYRGINAIQLMSQGHSDRRWITYKQAVAVGAQVRKGEKGTPIQYWKFSDEQIKTHPDGQPVLDDHGEPIRQSVKLERPRVFFATVFNAEQIDGLAPMQTRGQQDWTAIQRAEQILQASGAVIHHGEQNRAFYRSASDSIYLPDRVQFRTADNYYATALHELSHWSGHASRLGRDLSHPFGSQGYAKEELRAEIASMILGDELGIGHDPSQHAAYVGSWIKALQDDPLEIFRAAADAEKIQDYVLAMGQQTLQTAQPDLRASHEMTLDEFVRQAEAEKLDIHHGRQWRDRHAAFSDAASLQEAIADVHHGAVNNALYLNTPGATSEERPSLPPALVLSAYPDLIAKFPDAFPLVQLPTNADQEVAAMPLHPTAEIERVLAAVARMSDPDGLTSSKQSELEQRRQAIVTTAHARTVSPVSFQQSANDGFGVDLPADWSGRIQVQGNVNQQIDGKPQVRAARSVGVDPAFFAVYAEHDNGMQQWLANFPSIAQAEALADQLRMVDALTEQNPHVHAAKLARVFETAVRRDPCSTDEQVSSARAARKYADGMAVLNAGDLQHRVAHIDHGREQTPAAAPVQGQLPADPPTQKTLLVVPYRDKDEARALGARWGRQQQAWYVPAGINAAPFAKWLQVSGPADAGLPKANYPAQDATLSDQAMDKRAFLAVPYGERIAARAAGAEWDRAARSWYAGRNADLEKLARWQPENVANQQGPAMTPQDEFVEALRSIGCVISGEHPVMDGHKHRISVEGDKFSEKAGAGFYVGHLDGHPAGYMKNNKTQVEMTWKSKGYILDPGEKARLTAEAATKLQAREAEQAQAHEATAQRVVRQMSDLVPVEQPTLYMQAKGIAPQAGVYTDRAGQTTYIPATDVDGKQWSMQYIQADGTKRFAKDSRKEGCFHVIGGVAALAQAPALVIGEGYTTAASLSHTLGFATVAAFDSGNLPAVAKALHAKFPDKPVIIAGDDDRHLELTQGVNPGKAKAQVAAKISGGKAVLPIFAPGENSYPDDLPPVTPEKYREHQRTGAALSDQQLAALDRMKGKTDFNDLANKSALGKEGIERQVRAAVEGTIDKHQVQIEQHRKQLQQHDEPLQLRRAARVG